MKKQLLLLLLSVVTVVGNARTVTGTVTSAADDDPLMGVTVKVKGGTTGTQTDLDGNYSIEVKSDNAVLTFTFVGMATAEEKVGGRSVINVALSDKNELSEVVVTAMGQVQEKKTLNYSVQALNSDEVNAGAATNVVNTLQGKVAGVQVSMTGGSPNSGSQIIVRAISSINNAQNNEPLIVVDGMPIRGNGQSVADLNSNDIESMSVLKGAAASALYGQEGANGVILITTKSGKKGSISVTASASLEVSNVARAPKLQKKYIGGSQGFYTTNAGGGWGPLLRPEDTVYDNLGNFLGTGILQKYDLSISGGGEKFSSYASVNYMDNEGVVPKDYRKRLGFLIKGEYNPSEQVKITMSTNVIETTSRGFGNSMSTIYGWAINKDMSDYKLLNGLPNWAARYDAWDELTNSQRLNAGTSPYYGRNMDHSETQSTRVIYNGQISYTPIKNLTFTGKIGYDKAHSTYESYVVPRFDGSEFIGGLEGLAEENLINTYYAGHGSYDFEPSRSQRFTAQATGNYLWEINDKFKLNFFLGAEYSESKSYSATVYGQNFLLDGGFYSLNNVDPTYFANNITLNHAKRNKFGYFGEIRFDYRGMAQLSVTGRMDGSSTLKQVDAVYFYPSVTAGVIFSELFKISNDVFSYGKIRGNFAKVGKDAPANQFSRNFKQWPTFPDGGFGVNPTLSSASYLEPEMTSTWEIGTDLQFFKRRTRLDLAYYSTTVDNQIVTVRVSPAAGMILQTRNEGEIENYGVEATLGQDIITTKDFEWTANLNFSFNRGRVRSLPDGITELQGGQYGDVYASAFLGGSTTALTGKDYLRTEDGQIVIDENGYPLISPSKQNLIGNREPKFLLGLGSTFRYKDVTMSFLFDGRCGGDVYNRTSQINLSNGQNYLLERYRNREVIFNGVVQQPDGTYKQNTTPVVFDSQTINNYFVVASSNFVEDGSYIRLSYVTVAYDFGKLMKKLGSRNPVKGLKISATGRNLFLLTKYTGCDPQVMNSASYGTGSMGIDAFNVPSLRSFNFNVNLTF